jgi:hypothetical protein
MFKEAIYIYALQREKGLGTLELDATSAAV